MHGWEVRGADVSASDDGGRTWHVVFRDGRVGSVQFVLRSSPSAGVIVAGAAPATFVTSDAGRHWYTDATGVGTDALAVGHAFFWARNGGIVQVVDWPPPRSKLHCGGHWYHRLGGPFDAFGPKPRNICLGGRGVALRTRIVWSVPPNSRWTLDSEALVPGGIVAAAFDQDTFEFTALIVYRNAHASVTASLPPLPSSGDTLPRGRLHVFVAWPQLLLVAANGLWTSSDGGLTWSASATARQ